MYDHTYGDQDIQVHARRIYDAAVHTGDDRADAVRSVLLPIVKGYPIKADDTLARMRRVSLHLYLALPDVWPKDLAKWCEGFIKAKGAPKDSGPSLDDLKNSKHFRITRNFSQDDYALLLEAAGGARKLGSWIEETLLAAAKEHAK